MNIKDERKVKKKQGFATIHLLINNSEFIHKSSCTTIREK